MTKLTQLQKDIFSGSFMAAVNMVLLFISYPIYLQYLGVELYGLWATFSVILVFGEMGQMGINQSIIKFISESIELNDNGDTVAEYITGAFCILIFSSILFVTFIFLFHEYFVNLLNLPDQYIAMASNLFLWFSLLVPTVVFVQLLKGILMGLGKVELSNYLFIIGDISKISLAIYLLSKGYEIFSLYFGWLLSNVLLIILYIVFSKNNLQKIIVFKRAVYRRIWELLQYGKYLLGQTAVSIAFLPMITILIARYIGLTEVTYFNISWKIVDNIKVIFSKGLQGIIPQVATLNNLFQEGNKFKAIEKLQNIHRKSLLFVMSIGFPIILVLFIFSEPILKIWLDNSFHPLFVFSLNILLFSLIFELPILPIWYIFLGINKPNYNFYSAVIKFIPILIIVGVLIILASLTFERILFSIVGGSALYMFYLTIKYIQLNNQLFRKAE